MKTVNIKEISIGEGAPAIIVSIMGADMAALAREAEYYKTVDFDILEWRADYLDDINNIRVLTDICEMLRIAFPGKPLLFTIRSQKEGGLSDLSDSEYTRINRAVSDSGLVDMIDLELFGPDPAGNIEYIHSKNICVVLSNHDFEKTPPKEEIITRLHKMQTLGADILKIAVMPSTTGDLLTLLAAAAEMRAAADRPVIAISMGKTGVLSRIAGEIFGSCATFGAARQSSAPGQIDAAELRQVIDILHKNLNGSSE